MFKKALRVILNELKLGSFEFGGMKFYKPEVSRIDDDDVYRLEFEKDGELISSDFLDSYEIFIGKPEVHEKYLSIVSKGLTHFCKDIPMDSYIRLDFNSSTIETLIENGVKFFITSKSGALLMSVTNYKGDFKLYKVQNYISLETYSEDSSPAFEVFIPKEGSEIRIYF